jgi:mannose-6-phosphate isomerase-like protein (cupin superfamily)
MGYRVVERDEVETVPDRPCELRRLSEAAELSEFAVNVFSAEPGEQIPLAYHYHEEQEEAFYVLSGTLHVETPEETYEVDEDALFAADPESPHRAYNPADADATVVVLAMGAPAVSGDAREYDPEDER